MDKLDQLISKFKEAKEELEKTEPTPPGDVEPAKAETEELEKGMKVMSPDMKSQLRADSWRAQAPKAPAPQASTGTTLTSPHDTARANMLHGALHGEFQPRTAPKAPAAPVNRVTTSTKLTGLDRVRAEGQKEIKKDETQVSGIRQKPVNISPTTQAIPKLRPGNLAHPGAYQNRPSPVQPTPNTELARPAPHPQDIQTQVPLGGGPPTGVHTFAGAPTATGRAVMGTPEPTHSGQTSPTQPGTPAGPTYSPEQARDISMFEAEPTRLAVRGDSQRTNVAIRGNDQMTEINRTPRDPNNTAEIRSPVRPQGGHSGLHTNPFFRKGEDGPKFEKTVNTSTAPNQNMAKGCGEKLSLNKGGQWNLTKSANEDHCSHCKKKPCTCIKTAGVLVDKMDGGDMSGGSGV